MNDNFTLLEERNIPQFRCKGIFLEHKKTKMKVFQIQTNVQDSVNHDTSANHDSKYNYDSKYDNDENTFAFFFHTIPYSDNGIAHIMEHSVLAGSKKYNFNDPFMNLIKTSAANFMNASTHDEFTWYPCSSSVKQDYFNCLDVYMDAIFNPLLSENIFNQEAHRFDIDENGDVSLTGVVYNEMKSAFSDKNRISYLKMTKELIPGTKYANESGGYPDNIPELTYQEYLDFHKKYYHPSNGMVVFSGNIGLDENLEKLQEYLQNYDYLEIDRQTGKVELWDSPKYAQATTISTHEDSKDESNADNLESNDLFLSYVIKTDNDRYKIFLASLISNIIIGSSSSPIREAIINSGLGSVHPYSGKSTILGYVYFMLGLSDLAQIHKQDAIDLIENELKRLANEGINEDLLHGIISSYIYEEKMGSLKNQILSNNQKDFLLNMNINPSFASMFPASLILDVQVFSSFMYYSDPFQAFSFQSLIDRFNEEFKQNPNLIKQLIKEWFLDNNHKLTMFVIPDKDFILKSIELENQRCKEVKSNSDMLEKVSKINESLREFQDKSDTKMATELLPKLSISAIKKEVSVVKTDREIVKIDDKNSVTFLMHDTFCQDIVFFNAYFDITNSIGDIQNLSILCQLFGEMGTDIHENYSDLSNLIMRYIGYLSISPEVFYEKSMPHIKITVSASYLKENTEKALEIICEILTKTNLNDKPRLKDNILEHKNSTKNSMLQRGQTNIARYARSFVDDTSLIKEHIFGVSNFRYMQSIKQKDIEKAFDELKDNLFTCENLLISLVTDAHNINEQKDKLVSLFASRLAKTSRKIPLKVPKRSENRKINILQFPSKGAYCSIAFKTHVGVIQSSVIQNSTGGYSEKYNEQFNEECIRLARQNILSLYLLDYLLREVRFKGGAYGAGPIFRRNPGSLAFYSYRDPQTTRTLERFKKSLISAARKNKIDALTLEKYKINVLSKAHAPIKPSEKTSIIAEFHFQDITTYQRQLVRDNVFALTSSDVMQEAKLLLSYLEQDSCSAILTGSELINSQLEVYKQDVIKLV